MKLLRLMPRFRSAYLALDELERRESWSRRDIAGLQLERINDVWRDAVRHVPHYRRMSTELDLPPSFASIEEYQATVPLLPKAVVRSKPRSFLSEETGRGSWHTTSGSTGRPMSFFWTAAAHREILRARYRFYASWGVDVLDRTAFLWGSEERLGLAGRIEDVVERIQDAMRRRLRLSAFDLAPDAIADNLRRLARFAPKMLYGFSQAVYLYAVQAQALDFTCDTLTVAVLTGEVAHPRMRRAVETAFGVPATLEYGATECNLIAGGAPDGSFRVREDVVLVETVPRPDARYDIVISVLANPAFPLLRYVIEDVTDEPALVPDAGFASLANVAGRDDELILTSNGTPIHATRIDAIFEEKETARRTRRYRAHQHADGSLSVLVELMPDSTVDPDRLQHRLQTTVGQYPVSVEIADSIPQTAAGKHRVVTSDLASRLGQS